MNGGNGRARRQKIEDNIKRTKVSKEACEKAQDELKNLHSVSAMSGGERPLSAIVSTCCPRCQEESDARA